jgi:hypothetical protein
VLCTELPDHSAWEVQHASADAHVGVGIMQTHSIRLSMKGVCHLPFVKGQQRMCAICPFQEGSGSSSNLYDTVVIVFWPCFDSPFIAIILVNF